MRKSLLFIFIIGLLVSVPVVLASSISFPIRITTDLPKVTLACCGDIYYQLVDFEVDTAGFYVLTTSNNHLNKGDPWLWFYASDVGGAACNKDTNLVAQGRTLGRTLQPGIIYTIGANTAYGSAGNGGNPVVGTYNLELSGPGDIIHLTRNSSCNPPAPSDDPDNDGISGDRDNCPYHYNPDQEDGWGSPMGDVCDTDWYNQSGQGLAGFEQKNGVYHLHGNCTYMADGDPRCPVIARFDPSAFDPAAMPLDATSGDAGTWSVMIYYLHSNYGYPVYQVNVYTTNPPQPDTLLDDRLELHVRAGGAWTWHMRGGANDYNGI
jgi:hypothetical protein